MKILTLNIWGAPYAKDRSERVAAIADEVQVLDPDIVLFQEVYLPDNRDDLIERLVGIWEYYQYFPSGLVGSGLLTMSKFPIVDGAFHAFSMRGKPEDIRRGDYYAQKGIALTRIETPAGMVDVYNSHTHAQYDPDNDNDYAVYTETNLYEAARFIEAQSGAGAVILCGDLNTRPDQAGYNIITTLGSLVDAYWHIHRRHDDTFAVSNPYVTSIDQCLDYVLVRNMSVTDIKIVMTEPLSGAAQAYSDHYGLLATVDFGGEHLKSYESALREPLAALYQRVTVALIEVEAAQYQGIERAVLGLGGLVDFGLVTRFVGRFSPSLARFLRRMSVLGTLGYSLWQVVQVGVNLQTRRNTLRALRNELQKQMESGRLFDGRELSE